MLLLCKLSPSVIDINVSSSKNLISWQSILNIFLKSATAWFLSSDSTKSGGNLKLSKNGA